MASPQAAVRERHIEWLRRASRRRRAVPEDQLAHAWRVARKAAQILRERYGVKRVRVFGSLLHPERFHAESDVDLAVEGLTAQEYWDALADVLFLDDKVAVELVDSETCPKAIWATVEREGVDL